MEIELKYLCDYDTAKKILESETGDNEASVTKRMTAFYLDTADEAIRDAKIAYRVRREGDDYLATVKYGGNKTSDSALHMRREVNVSVSEEFFAEPRIDVFEDYNIYKLLDKAVGGQYSDNMGVMRPVKKLMPVISMYFVRTEHEIKLGESGKTTVIISYDEGRIIAGGKNEAISELEIELISGSKEDLVSFGAYLQGKYPLTEGLKSKYARGLKLIQPPKDKKSQK